MNIKLLEKKLQFRGKKFWPVFAETTPENEKIRIKRGIFQKFTDNL